jgi:hypothetical protein
VQAAFRNSPGKWRLEDLAIGYPQRAVEIVFSPQSYFEFALRSLDEILTDIAAVGTLSGPKVGQFV